MAWMLMQATRHVIPVIPLKQLSFRSVVSLCEVLFLRVDAGIKAYNAYIPFIWSGLWGP